VKQFYISMEALAPLTVRADHAHDGAATLRYIPGPAFIGSLAATHKFLYPGNTDQFERFFLRDQVLYPNLYPAIFNDEGLQGRRVPVYPVPRTAQSCKRHSGFRFPEKDNDAHGVRDSLIDRTLFALGSRSEHGLDYSKLLAILREHENCTCGETMDHFDGYYRRNDVVEHQMISAQADSYTRLRTHTGIDRQSGTVQEGILYNREVFGEGMQFFGVVKLPDDEKLVAEVQEFLNDVGSKGLLRIGTGRTRGMGKVGLSADRVEDKQDRFTTFTKRLDDFDRLLHDQAKGKLSGLDSLYFFALTLHSPLILCDDLLRYRGTIDKEALAELCGREIPGLERVYQAASVRRITGWQELWGMPRTNEYAIDMGSVFLFACSAPLDSSIYRALFELEEHGAGQRRVEGFGRLCVSDQFHQEIDLR
jgi:CRISPR-associated protein Csx10